METQSISETWRINSIKTGLKTNLIDYNTKVSVLVITLTSVIFSSTLTEISQKINGKLVIILLTNQHKQNQIYHQVSSISRPYKRLLTQNILPVPRNKHLISLLQLFSWLIPTCSVTHPPLSRPGNWKPPYTKCYILFGLIRARSAANRQLGHHLNPIKPPVVTRVYLQPVQDAT